MSQCTIIRPGASFAGHQGLQYAVGVSAESAGSRAICMHRLTLPPGARAHAHLHEQLGPSDFLHIPAGVPHLPANTSSESVEAVIARSDPNEQESVVLLPELDALPHLPPRSGDR